jgi:surface protein
MDSLNNVLFEASIAPYVYNNFTLVDYINDEYWDVDSIDNIEATIGETALTHNGNTPVVTWTMNEVLISGQSAKLTIDITLKNAGAIAENTFLPTNDHETIQSSLPETPDENITSELTPVLKSSYKVTYEPNLPSDCSAYGGTLPAEQNYLPLSIIQKSSNTISCDGYNFNGWEIAEGGPKILNDDYFKIIDDDVVLRATWTKPSISKSMDGEVKEEVAAVLDTGQNINVALKKLSGQSDPSYSTINMTIKAIKTATSMSAAQPSNAAIISTTNSAVPIYAWFDDTDGSIYVYSEADVIQGNSDMRYMFYGTSSLINIDALANWDTSKVTSMQSMFSGASSLTNIDALAGWDTSSVTSMDFMFYGATSLANIDGASNWDTSKVTNMSYMFYSSRNLTNIDGASNWDTSKVTYMSNMFYSSRNLTNIDGASNWDTSKVTTMNNMFQNASSLANIDGASNWDTSKVTNMNNMFSNASSLTNIDGASGWDTSSVTGMSYMFYSARNLTNIDGASDWDTSSVTIMSSMFQNASSLTDIDALANWNTSKVTNMSSMFANASSLANIDGASGWDTSKVTNMGSTFYGASALTNIDGASDWDTSSVTNMSYMFRGASSLANIDGASGWDTSSVTSMSYMFYSDAHITSLKPIFGWTVQSSTTKTSMFNGIPTSVVLPGWYMGG